jgi:hypothetical protein
MQIQARSCTNAGGNQWIAMRNALMNIEELIVIHKAMRWRDVHLVIG